MKTLISSVLLAAAALSANAYAGSNEVDTPAISTMQQDSSSVSRADVQREMQEHPAQQISNELGQSGYVRTPGNVTREQVQEELRHSNRGPVDFHSVYFGA